MGPNYKRPDRCHAASFRAPDPLPPGQAASLADLKWFEVFKDEQLQDADPHALERNYDLRDAVARVEAGARQPRDHALQSVSELRRGASRGNQSPLARRRDAPARAVLPSQNRNFGTAALQLLSFEIDIWGKLRRATEAARANLLSADETRKAVVTTLVSDVATAYLTCANSTTSWRSRSRTLQTRQESLELTRSRQTGGVSTLARPAPGRTTGLYRAETIPQIQQQIEQTENQITPPAGGKPEGRCFADEASPNRNFPPKSHPACPPRLLERRPDIRAAEQDLIAANAEIGVARAAYFPQLSLSGLLGGQSTQLSSLFSGPDSLWNLAPAGHPADLHRRTAQVQRQAGRGRARARADSIRENHPDRVHRSLRRADRSSARAREPREAGGAGDGSGRPPAAGLSALSRRRGHAAQRSRRRSRSVSGATRPLAHAS